MIIGRKSEIKELEQLWVEKTSQFVAVFGRRRIGKTFLIRESFNYTFAFEHSGVADADLKDQLMAFRIKLKQSGLKDCLDFSNWFDAFAELERLLETRPDGKKVVFIDEVAWMDTPKSKFISALEHFWNSWCSARKDIILVICASATSWIINKVFHNYGGLHNRITKSIYLGHLSLRECEEFSNKSSLNYSRQEILNYYMIFGGVPFYWTLLKKGFSVSQNIDNLFFSPNSILKDEYNQLYRSIFKNPENYIKIIEALSSKKIGLSRNEIISKTKIPSTGNFTKQLSDLEHCGFIRKYSLFGKKTKDAYYQLIDNFTLFYFGIIAQNQKNDKNFWTKSLNTPMYNTWCGLAFERVCFMHIEQIKKTLGISGVISNYSSFLHKADDEMPGVQVDLLLDRNDGVINLIEIKYYSEVFSIDKDYEKKLLLKRSVFKQITKTKKSIFLTMIANNGVVDNQYSHILSNVIETDDLFDL